MYTVKMWDNKSKVEFRLVDSVSAIQLISILNSSKREGVKVGLTYHK